MSNIQTLAPNKLSGDDVLSSDQILCKVAQFAADRPPSNERDAVATWLAIQHLAVSPEITDVYYLPTGAPSQEIRLLEVNDLVRRDQDEVEAVDFGFDVEGLDYRLLVADLSSAEHQHLRSVGLPLPQGWVLDGARHWGRG